MRASAYPLAILTGMMLVSCSGGTDVSEPAPVLTTLNITLSATSIQVGQTATATVSGLDQNGAPISVGAISWSTDAGSVATVSPAGVVTGIAAGSAMILASSGGKQAQQQLTVVPVPVASVTVSPPSRSMIAGTTEQLIASTLGSDGAILPGRAVTWSSSDQTSATVSQTGIVTAVAPGSAIVTATSEGKSGTATITVTAVPVASVTVSPSPASFIAGSTQQFSATTLDANGATLTGRTVAWSSSDPSIATISLTGVATGVNPGITTITATSEGKSGNSVITVTHVPVASVSVSPSSPSISIGSGLQLVAFVRDGNGATLDGRAITWTSSDQARVTVSTTGFVSGVALGSATITATSEGKSGTALVSVVPVPVASVTVSPNAASVVAGETRQLVATTFDANGATLTGRSITWSSSDQAKATVSATGLVTGVAAGTATITATSEGKSGSSTITVTPIPNPVILTGIHNVSTFMSTCPTADAAYNTIRADFEIRSDGVLVTAPVTCSSPYTSSALTEELVVLQTMRAVYYMSQGTQGKLPWTSQALYEWMKSQIDGVNIHTGTGFNACCETINGKRFMILWRRSGTTLDQYRDWNGISNYLALLGHEVRHVAGPGHVNGCASFPLPTDPLGCDATYDLNNLGSYGVQYWLFSKWASGYLNVGIACAPQAEAQSYATFAASAANIYVTPSRFVTNTPPAVTATIPYGGICSP